MGAFPSLPFSLSISGQPLFFFFFSMLWGFFDVKVFLVWVQLVEPHQGIGEAVAPFGDSQFAESHELRVLIRPRKNLAAGRPLVHEQRFLVLARPVDVDAEDPGLFAS